MPRPVDPEVRDREIRCATLRVIARTGVGSVTIRRVAAELGRSTTAITHFVPDRQALLERAVEEQLRERRSEADALMRTGDDPLWTLIDWSVRIHDAGVWPALVSATAADVEPAITELVRAFERWWSDLVVDAVSGRTADGIDPEQAADAIGVVVDGLLLAADASDWTDGDRQRLARMLIRPLLADR